ncbi:Protein of unknown function [Pyronema omphalodes CBS 100304]|uniref:Uncharacterized protein n=1 Tax=Pyronema omphalodes (strain CBS 100304) TaxID=1076935 RepID=U4KYP1_PYROM|nr:Protein of unknown function [Pyronema omphalodes CBS 100304]
MRISTAVTSSDLQLASRC